MSVSLLSSHGPTLSTKGWSLRVLRTLVLGPDPSCPQSRLSQQVLIVSKAFPSRSFSQKRDLAGKGIYLIRSYVLIYF